MRFEEEITLNIHVMNSLFIHQEQEKTAFSSLLMKSSLISIFCFMLLLSGLLLQPDVLQHQQGAQPLNSGLLQASFTAITNLPTDTQKTIPPDTCPTISHASTAVWHEAYINSCCNKLKMQLRKLCPQLRLRHSMVNNYL